ncbi:MAG: hypothetical protein F4Y94_09795, partial [Chloroflexi bacterium]|nr:hypothetical protein [Chloroflexota bacterium]
MLWSLVVLALALAIGLPAALENHSASAQTTTTLVSNPSQGSSSHRINGTLGQAFRTGSHSGGYVIRTVELQYRHASGHAVDLSLWNADSSGNPTSRLTADFARPVSFPSSATTFTAISFTAPPGTILSPSRNYAVVVATNGQAVNIKHGTSPGSGASGWSIYNGSRSRPTRFWAALTEPTYIAVKGEAITSLVSNLGQPALSDNAVVNSIMYPAQWFRAGGKSTVTSVEVYDNDKFSNAFDVSLWTARSGGLPAQKRADFTRPDSFTGTGNRVFTAPPNTRLDGPFGDYSLVMEAVSNQTRVGVTNTTAEDSGAARNWSIGNQAALNTGGTWMPEPGGILRIRVNGFLGHPPGTPGNPVAAVVERGKVLVRWTAAGAGTSPITGYAVEVSTDAGASWSQAGTVAATATSFTDTRAGPHDDVRYRVSALSTLGMGNPTDALSVDPGGITLVSNLGQASWTGGSLGGNSSTSFVSRGTHTVSSIELETTGSRAFDVAIWTSDANRLPSQHLLDLDPPDTFQAGTVKFTVPRDKRFTTVDFGVYVVVVTARDSGATIDSTTSDLEDAGRESNWSIADAYGSLQGGSWTLSTILTPTIKMRVNGYRGHVPEKPTALSARATGPSRIALAWTAPSTIGGSAIAGYRVEVSPDGSAWTVLVADTGSTDTTYAHTGFEARATRHYRVSALNGSGAGPVSATATETADVLASNAIDGPGRVGPSIPANSRMAYRFTAGDNPSGYRLTAVDISSRDPDGDSFSAAIWAADDGGLPTGDQAVYTLTAPSSFAAGWLTFTAPENATLQAGNDYVVVVNTGSSERLITGLGRTTENAAAPGAMSGWSFAGRHNAALVADLIVDPTDWVNFAGSLAVAFRGEAILGTPPGAPTGLTAVAPGQTQINLAWTAPSESGTSAITGYKIEVSTDGATWTELVANTSNTTTTYNHTGLAANSTRHYRVSAISSSGAGEPSGVATETTNVLVGNILQPTTADEVYLNVLITISQGFTTGGNTGGYSLTAIEVLSKDPNGTAFTADLYEADTTGHPTGNPTRLTAPTGAGAFAAGRVRFTAPPGTTLKASTTYAVVVLGDGSNVSLAEITQDGEDPGAASNWSVANAASLDFAVNPTGWVFYSDGGSMGIAVRGQANAAPVFSQAAVTRRLAENTPAGRDVGAPVKATDADGENLTYELGGTDAASFAINEDSGQIQTKAGVSYNFEAKSSYTVTVTASDGIATATATVTINLDNVLEPPRAPGAPTVAAVTGSTTSLAVSWTAPENAGRPTIESYDLQYREGVTGSWTAGPRDQTGLTATISGLSAGGWYQVQVRATNADGDSAWSVSGLGNSDPTITDPPVFPSGAEVAGRTLEIVFTGPLLALPGLPANAFTVTQAPVGGRPAPVPLSVDPIVHGVTGTVTLVLEQEISDSTTDVRVSYTRPFWLFSTDGEMVSSFTDLEVSVRARNGGGARASGFEFDLASDNGDPRGIWFNNQTNSMWVTDAADARLYFYRFTPGVSGHGDALTDVEFTLASENDDPRGIWSDGETVWVTQPGANDRARDDQIMAYRMSDGSRDPGKDWAGDALRLRRARLWNTSPQDIFSHGSRMWVVDSYVIAHSQGSYWARERTLAYNFPYQGQIPNGDISHSTITTRVDDLTKGAKGVWSDGVTLWVSDNQHDKLFAYRLSDRRRDPTKDFNGLAAAGNNDPRGIWSTGGIMWVVDAQDGKFYAYEHPVYPLRAWVTGTSLIVEFNQNLGAASVPNSAFAVTRTAGGAETRVPLSGSPVISGKMLTLTLASPVPAGESAVKLTYAASTTTGVSGNRLVSSRGVDVKTFDHLHAPVFREPRNLRTTVVGRDRIDLAWDAPGGVGRHVTGYKVEASSDGSTWRTLVANQTARTYSHLGLEPDSTWRYRVSAINGVMTGPDSRVVSETTNVLVSNTNQPSDLLPVPRSPFVLKPFEFKAIQLFTTGSETHGYGLSSIEVTSAEWEPGAPYTVEIWGTTTDHWTEDCGVRVVCRPVPDEDTVIARLSAPTGADPSRPGQAVFRAPQNITLERDTTYALVYVHKNTFKRYNGIRLSTNADAGAASGWSIADYRYHIAPMPTVPGFENLWWVDTETWTIRIRGTVNSIQSSEANTEATGLPGISGTARVGEELTAKTNTIEDEDGLEDATFAYQWLADGEAIGASGRTYTVGDGYVGVVLSVRVTFTDDAGNEETLTSEPTAEVVANSLALESATVDGATLTLTFPEALNMLVDLP